MSTTTGLFAIWGIAALEGCCAAFAMWFSRRRRDPARDAELRALEVVREIDRLRANAMHEILSRALDSRRQQPPRP